METAQSEGQHPETKGHGELNNMWGYLRAGDQSQMQNRSMTLSVTGSEPTENKKHGLLWNDSISI